MKFIAAFYSGNLRFKMQSGRHICREKLPSPAVFMCITTGIIGLNVAPLLLGSSFYVVKFSDSTTAAIIAMLFCIGNMVSGVLYPMLYRLLKRKSLSAFLIICAVGLLTSATANHLVLLGLGFFIGGIDNACMQAGGMMLLGLLCSPSQLGFASVLMMAFFNLGSFLCSSWESLIGSSTGNALYAPLFIGTVIFIVLAIIMFVKSPFPEEKNKFENSTLDKGKYAIYYIF